MSLGWLVVMTACAMRRAEGGGRRRPWSKRAERKQACQAPSKQQRPASQSRAGWITVDLALRSGAVCALHSARHADMLGARIGLRGAVASAPPTLLAGRPFLGGQIAFPLCNGVQSRGSFACHSCGSGAVNQSMTVCPLWGKSVPGKPVVSSSACFSCVFVFSPPLSSTCAICVCYCDIPLA